MHNFLLLKQNAERSGAITCQYAYLHVYVLYMYIYLNLIILQARGGRKYSSKVSKFTLALE